MNYRRLVIVLVVLLGILGVGIIVFQSRFRLTLQYPENGSNIKKDIPLVFRFNKKLVDTDKISYSITPKEGIRPYVLEDSIYIYHESGSFREKVNYSIKVENIRSKSDKVLTVQTSFGVDSSTELSDFEKELLSETTDLQGKIYPVFKKLPYQGGYYTLQPDILLNEKGVAVKQVVIVSGVVLGDESLASKLFDHIGTEPNLKNDQLKTIGKDIIKNLSSLGIEPGSYVLVSADESLTESLGAQSIPVNHRLVINWPLLEPDDFTGDGAPPEQQP